MNREILNQALITMGYRKMDKDIYGKPVGFCIIISKIENDNKVIFKSIFNNYSKPEEKLVYNSYIAEIDIEFELSNEELYEICCKIIAYAEIEICVGKAMETGRKDSTFAFSTITDIMSEFSFL